MKRFLFTVMKMFFICLFLLSGMERIHAQVNVDPAEYSGTGTDITSLTFNSNGETVERVLLYNVGKDMFLNAGGFWGTRITTFTVGLPLMLIKNSNGTYRIRGPFNNAGTGNMLGLVENAGGGDRGVYYDRGTSNGVNWTFELHSSKENANGETDYIYKVWVKRGDNSGAGMKSDYMLVAKNFMTVTVFKSKNDNLVRALPEESVTEDNENYSLWKIVTTKQMTTDFPTTYNRKNPSDATFLLRAQNFNRMNMYNGEDPKSAETLGWHKSKDASFSYSCTFDDVKNYSGDNRYGMFFCGGITKGKTGEKLYQTVEITKSGWYRVDCEGFFYNSSDPDKSIARLYAMKEGASPNSASNAYMDLLPKSYGEPYAGEELVIDDTNKAFIIPDGIVSNKVEAGITFYEQLYPNHLLVYVNFNEASTASTKIELGIELTGDMAADDYVYFDDFQLRYLGESFALDEGMTDFHNGMGEGDNKSEYKNRVMIFKRTYKNDTWNSICLPVDLTKEQLNTAFFPNPKLAKLVESDTPETIAFQMVDLSSLRNEQVALRKGECYLIKPGYAGRTDEGVIDIGNANNTKITAPYYTIDRVTLTKKDVETDLGFSSEDNVHKFIDRKDLSGTVRAADYYPIKDSDCKLRVYGTFEKLGADDKAVNPLVPKTSYTFVNGKLYHLTGAYAQKGFSCWIEDEHQVANPETQSHTLNFTTYIGGISDNTTAIEDFTADVTERDLPQAVYNLQGQAVRRGTTSLEGLARGMYIVNGKKVAVRE
ncbi:MAG: hypothetical protein IJY03_03405 [Prevotella sp.]|nr:hypothetical protein [Prevotella sp.]